MAIQFARLQYVKRSAGQSACHKAAYNARCEVMDQRTGEIYDYSHKKDELLYHAIVLPEGVSERYKDVGTLWNAVEAAEKRYDAQLAKEMVLALPDNPEVTLDLCIEMVHKLTDRYFVEKGLICQINIHASDNENNHNRHAHVMMVTRRCAGEIFGLKARDLDVEVRGGVVVANSNDKQWGRTWATLQNETFKEKGFDFVVDPIGVIPQIHLGPQRMRGEKAYLTEVNNLRIKANERASLNPGIVMDKLLKEHATFVRADVERYVNKYIQGSDREDFLGRFWTQKDIVLVGEDKFTSRSVLEADRRMVRIAERLSQNSHERVEKHHELDLTEAQKVVEEYVLSGNQLVCIEGKAGTGKSYVMGALRLSYIHAGYTVRGLAFTSAVVDNMKKEGFKDTSTLHRHLFCLYNNKGLKVPYGGEVWLVDEASMVGSSVMHEVVQQALVNRAKLVLIGDDGQIGSIERGGGFKALCERFGSISLDEVVRQKDVDQRQLTAMISRGDTRAALDQMAQKGAWLHYDKEGDAVSAMMATWYGHHNQNPSESFMILEFRNRYVAAFNEHIHKVLQARGEVGDDDIRVRTAEYGWCAFSVGDRLVFRQNERDLGVHNGMQGFLLEASKERFVVQVGEERKIVFNPQSYDAFQHGYAGTIHSAQGGTFDRVYALHSSHINQNLFYVACSRHRLSCHYFSHGNSAQVYKDVERQEQKTLACEDPKDSGTLKESGYNWILNFIVTLQDRMCRNHEFYRIPERHHRMHGVMITDADENRCVNGYVPLYREIQDLWPDIAGEKVQMTTKHRDLEPLLRDLGVAQCVLLDDVQNKHLIGPHDRFGELKRDKDYRVECTLSEVQMRLRLHTLEQRLGEHPDSVEAMKQSQAYQTLCQHEQTLRPELAQTYDTHTVSQILYHYEKTGSMPTTQEIEQIQVRVNHSVEQYSARQQDAIFVDSLEYNDPHGKHAKTLMDMHRSQQLER